MAGRSSKVFVVQLIPPTPQGGKEFFLKGDKKTAYLSQAETFPDDIKAMAAGATFCQGRKGWSFTVDPA
jgi:hypothetical protein